MSKFPLISIIVPAYNAEKWIEECISSVRSQTYPEIELIIIDDGSTDNTLSVARDSVAGIKNAKVIHTENGGVCRARNRGLDEARGECFFFIDADDVLISSAIADLYSEMVTNEADIAVGWEIIVNEEGNPISHAKERVWELWTGKQGVERALCDDNATYAVWGKLYKRDIVGVTRFINGKRIHEDSFFVFECLEKQPKVVVTDKTVIRYRMTPNSASRAEFSEKFLDILYFAEEKKKIVESKYPELMPLAENMIVKANMVLLTVLLKTNDKKYRALKKECIKKVKHGKKFFTPATSFDRKWFFVITHGLYDVYKLLRRVKRQVQSKILTRN